MTNYIMDLPVTVNPQDLFDPGYSRFESQYAPVERVRRRSSLTLYWSNEDPSISYNECMLGLPPIPPKPLPSWVYQDLQNSEKKGSEDEDIDRYLSDFISEDEEPYYSLNTILYSPKVQTSVSISNSTPAGNRSNSRNRKMNWPPLPGPIQLPSLLSEPMQRYHEETVTRGLSPQTEEETKVHSPTSGYLSLWGSPFFGTVPLQGHGDAFLPHAQDLTGRLQYVPTVYPQVPRSPGPTPGKAKLAPSRTSAPAINTTTQQPSLKRKREDSSESPKVKQQRQDTRPLIACRWATPSGTPCTTMLSQDCFLSRGNPMLKKHLVAAHGFRTKGMLGENIIECQWAVDKHVKPMHKHCSQVQYGSLSRHMRTRGHILSEDPTSSKSTIKLQTRRCEDCGQEHFRAANGKCDPPSRPGKKRPRTKD